MGDDAVDDIRRILGISVPRPGNKCQFVVRGALPISLMCMDGNPARLAPIFIDAPSSAALRHAGN